MWKWIERKLFRRLELRLSGELDGRFAVIQQAVTRAREEVRSVAAHVLDVDSQLEEIIASMRRADRAASEMLAFIKTASDVTRATLAADHAGKLEQLSRHVSQAIALQWGKTTDPNSGPVLSRAPREFDNDRRQ